MGNLTSRFGTPNDSKEAPAGSSNLSRRFNVPVQKPLLNIHPEVPEANTTPTGTASTEPRLSNNPIVSFIQKGIASTKSSRQSPLDMLRGLDDATKLGVAQGATRFIGGAGEVVAGAGELVGVLPEGYSSRVAGGANQLLEDAKEAYPNANPHLAEGVSMLTQAAPLLPILPAATTGKAILQSGKVGGFAAGTSFIENEEEAGLSLERATRTAVGSALGLAFSAIASAPGALRSKLGQKDIPRQETSKLSTKELRLAKESHDLRVPTTPGAASNQPVILANEGRVFGNNESRFKAQAAGKKGNKAAKSLIDDFLDDVLPERKRVQPVSDAGVDGAPSQIAELYNKAKTDTFSISNLQSRLKDKGLIKTFDTSVKKMTKGIRKDEIIRQEMSQYKANQIVYLDRLKKQLDLDIESKTLSTDANKKAGLESLKALRREVLSFADEVSPTYSKARNLASRNFIVKSIDKRLGAKAVEDGGTSITDVSPVDFYRGVLKNKKQMADLTKDLQSIKDPNQRSLALRKARQLRRVLARWEKTEPILLRAASQDTPVFQERVSEKGSIVFTIKRALEQNKSNGLIDFMISDKWAVDVLEKAVAAKSPANFGAEFAGALNTIAQKSRFNTDTAGRFGLEPVEGQDATTDLLNPQDQ